MSNGRGVGALIDEAADPSMTSPARCTIVDEPAEGLSDLAQARRLGASHRKAAPAVVTIAAIG